MGGTASASFGEGVDVSLRCAGVAEAGVVCQGAPYRGLPRGRAAEARFALPVQPVVVVLLQKARRSIDPTVKTQAYKTQKGYQLQDTGRTKLYGEDTGTKIQMF